MSGCPTMGDASSGPKAARISSMYAGATPWCASFCNSGFSAVPRSTKRRRKPPGSAKVIDRSRAASACWLVAFGAVKHAPAKPGHECGSSCNGLHWCSRSSGTRVPGLAAGWPGCLAPAESAPAHRAVRRHRAGELAGTIRIARPSALASARRPWRSANSASKARASLRTAPSPISSANDNIASTIVRASSGRFCAWRMRANSTALFRKQGASEA